MTHKHGGNIYKYQKAADFSANINFCGMPESVRQAALRGVEESLHYPEPESSSLRKILADREGVSEDMIFCGNGAAEVLFLLMQALRPRHAVLVQPCFFEYEQALTAVDCAITHVYLQEEEQFQVTQHLLEAIPPQTDLIVLGNPNNPTGQIIEKDVLEAIQSYCQKQEIWLVLDESFSDFLTDEDAKKTKSGMELNGSKIFVVKSFTKMYAMPGLRFGYGICRDKAVLEAMICRTQPWNVSRPAQEAAKAAAQEREFAKSSSRMTRENREWMTQQLQAAGYQVVPSCTNYLFFSGPAGLVDYALERGYLIRDCSNFRGLERQTDQKQYYRICIRSQKENEGLLAVLQSFRMEKEGVTWQKQS